VTAVGAQRTPLRIGLIAALGAAIVVAVPQGGVASARQIAKGATVQTRKITGLGKVLVNSRGLTLYMFVPDHRKKVTCKGSCAVLWPPLKLKAGKKPTAGGAAKKSLLGTDKNPGGGRVVTYNRWPLYTYVADTRPGQATGQALNNSGGLWYVLSPAGKVIKKKP
jgi:predicted lipoprotein with Yx(FWY)xxD motif